MLTPIIILSILAAPLAFAFALAAVNDQTVNLKKYANWGLAGAFAFFAIGHFVQTSGMVEMLPAWVPYRYPLVYVTGVLELLVAIALLSSRWQATAAKTAITMLIVFFPANLYAAFNAIGLGGHQWGPSYLWIRTPLQIILIGWAYFLCLKIQSTQVEKTIS
ncbi:MAG: DoxX family protein [Cellvibrionaceae bacterium]